jgi:hypothetical protein
LNADCADHADGFKSIAVRNLNHRWPKTNTIGGCERSVIPLPFIKLLPSAICVHLRNLRPKLVQHLRVSLPVWEPIPDEHSPDFSPNLPDV